MHFSFQTKQAPVSSVYYMLRCVFALSLLMEIRQCFPPPTVWTALEAAVTFMLVPDI